MTKPIYSYLLRCKTCHSGLTSEAQINYENGEHRIEVDPCKFCLAQAGESAFDEGYEEGCEE